ncbi:hypothetical protein QUF64_12145 [Anaerolineales bacterium HSG6]|nr:hypothetical protein [Anaerolineales bacterium HSG6]
MPQEAIKTLVPAEVYTDRQEYIDNLYDYALSAKSRRAMSMVLLGQRRMGKTEIFKRVVNRLFFEQDHTDPQAVVPVYYSFRDKPLDRWEFALDYVENFLRWYAGFRLRNIDLLSNDGLRHNELAQFVENNLPPTKELMGILRVRAAIEEKGVILPEEEALILPRRISDRYDHTTVIFLDEFQNIRLPQYDFDIAGFMKEAVESPTCPHFVTGSAMSILAREIIGRGALFGRFRSELIESLSPYYGTELARNAASFYQANLSTIMAPVVAERCGHNPFYITAVMQQAAQSNISLDSEAALNELLAIDISSGFIWGELSDQVNRWIERINDHNITKWILYLAALEEEDELNIERIQRELQEREGLEVSVKTVREVLVKLSRGDLLEYMEFGGWFRTIKDPILLEFLKVWGRVEVERFNASHVQNELRNRYQRLKRQVNEYKGYLAEVFMTQVLWSAQRKAVPGQFFNRPTEVEFPLRFTFVRQRMRLGGGKGQEIDVFGAAGIYIWVCQSKWWITKQVDVAELELLLAQGEAASHDFNADPATLWMFAYNGLTPEAEQYAQEKGILWSNYEQFNDLLTHLGLRQLPEL